MTCRILLLFTALIFISPLYAQDENSDCPCCEEPYRQFDFWLGEWEVYQADGTLAGHNVITKIQDSCVIRENWTSARSNFTGTSYNFYDENAGLWKQVWIDNQGGSLILTGTRDANRMILTSQPMPDDKGQMTINRITWTANTDGTVRQLWQSSPDNKTWKDVFDGLYKPMN